MSKRIEIMWLVLKWDVHPLKKLSEYSKVCFKNGKLHHCTLCHNSGYVLQAIVLITSIDYTAVIWTKIAMAIKHLRTFKKCFLGTVGYM